MVIQARWARTILAEIIGATCLALAGCRDLESPTEGSPTRLVFHAVLDPDASSQVILVERARTGVAPVNGGFAGH